MIFLKILAFFAALIGIGFLLMMSFAGSPTVVSIITIVTVSIGGLAAADLGVFFIRLICKAENVKAYWKSFISLLIASAAALSIGFIFQEFLPNIPFVDSAAYGLSIVLLLAATVNLIYNALYMLFGTGRLTIPWKLFIFFMMLTMIFGAVYIFSDFFSEKFFNGSDTIATISLTSLSGSILLAIASLLSAIISGIYSKKSTNSLFKLFLSLIIVSASLFGVSGICHLINKPWRNTLIFASGAVLLVGVGVLIIIVFRVIFLNKPFSETKTIRKISANMKATAAIVRRTTPTPLRTNGFV